jgi:hypothetical protein
MIPHVHLVLHLPLQITKKRAHGYSAIFMVLVYITISLIDGFLLITYSLQTTRLRRRIPRGPFRDADDSRQRRSILLGPLLQDHRTLLVLSIHVLLQHVSGKSKDK